MSAQGVVMHLTGGDYASKLQPCWNRRKNSREHWKTAENIGNISGTSKNILRATEKTITVSLVQFEENFNTPNQISWNGDTLGPVELIVWPLLEESIIIFGMSKSSGFKKYSICWVFQALSVSLSLSLSFSLSLSLYLCPLIIFEKLS